MRILTISYGFMMLRSYQWKAVELASRCDGIFVVVPERWKDHWSQRALTPDSGPLDDIPHARIPMWLNVNKHFAVFPPQILRELLINFRPHVCEIENEPFNLGSAQLIAAVRKYRPEAMVFLHAAQNLLKRYPPPFNWLEQYVFRHCAGVFTRNDQSSAVLERRGLEPRKIHVLGHGVSLKEFSSAREQQLQNGASNGSVLYVGALTFQKGVDTLIRACARSHGFRQLTIAGDGILRSELEKLASQLGLADRTQFLGPVSQTGLNELYASHTCMVLPSRTTPTLVEQFGRVLIEAMAAGCPVIASTSGGIPAVVQDAGLLFKEEESGDLTTKLDLVFADNALRQKLQHDGIQRARDTFEWSVKTQEMISVFESTRRSRANCN